MAEPKKDMTFAAGLVRLRLNLPLRKSKPVQVQEVAKESGVNIGSYSQAENGIIPGDGVLYKLAKYYKVSVDFLLTGHIDKGVYGSDFHDQVNVSDSLKIEMRGPDGQIRQEDSATVDSHGHSIKYDIGQKKDFHVRSPDPDYQYGSHRGYKVHEALLMATRVLESDTSYADALYLNIQHFDRAIQAEERLSIIEDENKHQAQEISNLKKRLDILESKTPAPDGASKKSAEM